MASLATDLQDAVLRTLSTEAALPGISSVHDRTPAGYPHITFGRTGVCDWSGTENENEQLFTLHVWSKARSDDEALSIMQRARALLDGRTLALGDGEVAAVRLEFTEARHDEDLELRHGLLRFRATAGAAPRRARRPRGMTKA
ncbi:DUF3168 domain-containing protein [Mesorhizobium sp. 1B3]|uniref:DUF3168 domain-containing protein n=1 Tax=Mesorhizobium sp. 1B3 TaxID=3243599 RepID=UPI003D954A3A